MLKKIALRSLLFIAGLLLAGLIVVLILRVSRDDPEPARRPFLENLPRPAIFAHRGASGDAAENTLNAFALALRQGAHVLELDVHRSRDGHIVVSHDRTLERTHGDPRSIADLSLAELQEIAPEIPSLRSVFARFPGIPINIEIKSRHDEAALDLWKLILANNRQDTVLVASGSDAMIQRFREVSGGATATSAGLFEALTFYGCFLVDVPCRPAFDALQIPFRPFAGIQPADPAFIEFAHRHGRPVHYWTVNESTDMQRLIEAGADAIMTDYPVRFPTEK